jgi:hypothetical protein
MGLWNIVVPAVTTVVSVVFAALVLARWTQRRHLNSLLWGIGLLMFAVGTAMELLYGLGGWHPWVFRLWYLFGAVLVAAYLGMGTAYLLMHGKTRWVAHALMALLLIGSVYAAYRVFSVPLDPTQMIAGELSGSAITVKSVRLITPFFNSLGVILLVGGAIYSSWLFIRQHILRNRVIGNILIALGALSPAIGGILQRLAQLHFILYLSELLGVVLLFAGFLEASRAPLPAAATRTRIVSREQS